MNRNDPLARFLWSLLNQGVNPVQMEKALEHSRAVLQEVPATQWGEATTDLAARIEALPQGRTTIVD